MNSLLNDERDEDVEDSRSRYGKDREITLGTTVILGIFFALAVFGAVMFGFGYSMGAKRATGTMTAQPGADINGTFNNFKPAPGSPLAANLGPAAPAGRQAVVTDNYDPANTTPAVTAAPRPAPAKATVDDFDETPAPAPHPTPVTVQTPAPIVRAAAAATPTPVTSVAPAPGQFMVQIAAVSHQEDADLLVSTLKRRNYAVAVHHEPQDSLLHVQIGPFANKKDADAMRQRLLADGYNAITK